MRAKPWRAVLFQRPGRDALQAKNPELSEVGLLVEDDVGGGRFGAGAAQAAPDKATSAIANHVFMRIAP